MNPKLKLTLVLVLVVALFGGAYALYGSLSSSVETQKLAALPDSAYAEEQSENENSAAADAGNTGTNAASEPAAEAQDAHDHDHDHDHDDHDHAHGTAPDFTVTNAAGEAVQLEDYFGKPIVLNFWASWCGPCQSEMPDFQTAYETHGEDVHFLMVNLTDGARETVESAQAYADKNGFSFPLLFDTEGDASIAYGVMSIPSTYFIDAHGVPTAQASGALDLATLEKGIGMIR